tara:strand:- start:32 stop:448 length:417 start_codon:yes stop_codon:yes gene_type:complete
MSEILTNKLTGVSTAGSILVTGEGNSTTTNLQQGLAKAYHANSFSTGSFYDTFNISSKTERDTGSMYGNFTNNMNDANYVVVGGVAANAPASMTTTNTNRVILVNGDTSARYAANTSTSANAMNNAGYVSTIAVGDLA